MIVGVVVVAIVGVVVAAVQAARRQWSEAFKVVVGAGTAEMSYASFILHQVWINLVSLGIAAVATVVLLITRRRVMQEALDQETEESP